MPKSIITRLATLELITLICVFGTTLVPPETIANAQPRIIRSEDQPPDGFLDTNANEFYFNYPSTKVINSKGHTLSRVEKLKVIDGCYDYTIGEGMNHMGIAHLTPDTSPYDHLKNCAEQNGKSFPKFTYQCVYKACPVKLY